MVSPEAVTRAPLGMEKTRPFQRCLNSRETSACREELRARRLQSQRSRPVMGPGDWCGKDPPSAGESIGRGQGDPSTSGWSEDHVDGMVSRREGGCVEGNGELGAGVATDHGGWDAGIADSEFLDDVDRRKRPSREGGDEVI